MSGEIYYGPDGSQITEVAFRRTWGQNWKPEVAGDPRFAIESIRDAGPQDANAIFRFQVKRQGVPVKQGDGVSVVYGWPGAPQGIAVTECKPGGWFEWSFGRGEFADPLHNGIPNWACVSYLGTNSDRITSLCWFGNHRHCEVGWDQGTTPSPPPPPPPTPGPIPGAAVVLIQEIAGLITQTMQNLNEVVDRLRQLLAMGG
jgi:hypothetical protein